MQKQASPTLLFPAIHRPTTLSERRKQKLLFDVWKGISGFSSPPSSKLCPRPFPSPFPSLSSNYTPNTPPSPKPSSHFPFFLPSLVSIFHSTSSPLSLPFLFYIWPLLCLPIIPNFLKLIYLLPSHPSSNPTLVHPLPSSIAFTSFLYCDYFLRPSTLLPPYFIHSNYSFTL